MPAYIETFNTILALGTVVLQLALVVVFINIIFFRSTRNAVLLFFKKYGFFFAFLVALGAMGLSLFYSEVVGYSACELCIIQRIFTYPQVLFLGIILATKKKFWINISTLFAFLGLIVSIYHVYVENGGASSLACAGSGPGVVSCAARYVYEFGYITIPVMSLTAYAFILLVCLNWRYFSRKEIVAYTA